jgi:hypothetical protein
MTDVQQQIVNQITTALHNLGASVELLCIVGSWGDTLEDEEVLDHLTDYNTHGTAMTEVIASVYDTPKDRRDRFKVVYGAKP